MLSALIPSEHSYSAVHLVAKPIDQRFVQPGPLVLGSTSLKRYTPTVDKDQPVSRRSKPSSRTLLIGEQPNPWDLLQPQDRVSRHRGAEHRRRYGLLGGTSLLSPGYLLSVVSGRPIKDRRVAKFCFRTCATCKSCSQASLCLYTSSPISIRTKLTLINSSVTL